MKNSEDKIIVACNGCFDGLHFGHLLFLGYCLAQGNSLVVGINSDEYIVKHKRSNPTPQEQRAESILKLGCVEKVIIFNEETACNFISKVNPSVYCTGKEYSLRNLPEESLCKELNIKIVFVPRFGDWSSLNSKGGYKK